MSKPIHKNLRQTTLSFQAKPSNSKRKMEGGKSDVEEKRRKAADAAEKRISKTEPESGTSKYFDSKEVTENTPSTNKAKTTQAACAENKKSDGCTDTVEYEMSPELFDEEGGTDKDSQDVEDDLPDPDIPNKKPSMLKKESSWRGTKLSHLQRTPECLGEIKPLKSLKNHAVTFKLPYQYKDTDKCPPDPFPTSFKDMWDADHVRMPCSEKNEYPVEDKSGKTVLHIRWDLIKDALRAPIPGPYELEEAILTYNQRYAKKWNFTALNHYFTDHISKADRYKFFNTTLPKMIKLALKLPLLCTQPVPLLKQHKKSAITMSQKQAACLLANAFFCTFPRRNTRQRHAEYFNYPDINFNSLFQGIPNNRKMQKLRCIIHYFERVTTKMPLGTVTYERKVVDIFPQWEDMGTDFCKLHVSSAGTIEDNGIGMLQVDFANKYLGGGVLGHGCVQEEIRFLVCPEMILTRLFTEVLDQNESLVMTGCERFSKYEGYADSFTWDGDYVDETPRDVNGRLHTEVTAIDALVIRDFKKQFQKWQVRRELNKAYVGFHCGDLPPHQLSAVCTGNWGCGAFGGDKRLKALLQLMAASVARRAVCYFTFDDNNLTDDLYKIHAFISKEHGLSVGNVMQLVEQYNRNMCQKTHFGKPKKNLFEYMIAIFDGTLDSSTGEDFSDDSNEAKNFKDNEKVSDGNKLQREDSFDYKANTP